MEHRMNLKSRLPEHRRPASVVIGFALLAMVAATANATTLTCTESGAGNWTTSSLWAGCNNSFPTAPTDAVIVSGTVTENTSQSLGFQTLTINSGGVLNVATSSGTTAPLVTANQITNNGTINASNVTWAPPALFGTGQYNLSGTNSIPGGEIGGNGVGPTFNITSGSTAFTGEQGSWDSFNVSSGATLSFSGSGLLLGTIAGAGTVNIGGGSRLGSINNNATLNILGDSTTNTLTGTSTSTGTWNVASGGTLAISAASLTGGSYTGAGAYTLSGANTLSGFSNAATLNVASGAATIGGTNTNTGAITVASGASLNLQGSLLSLQGGSLTTTGTGVIKVTGASVLFGVANVAANNYVIGSSLTNTASDWNIASGNSTTVNSGGTLNESGNLTNAGALTVNTGGVLEAESYTQSAGTATINGSFEIGSLANPGSISITGGNFDYSGAADILGNIMASGNGVAALSGDSSIFGGVTLNSGSSLAGDHEISGYNNSQTAGVINGGTISDTDAINGNYTQTSTGQFDVQLSGTSAGQYNELNVNGTATLDGTLDVTLLNGFTPQAGDSFQIMTDLGTSGNFANFILPTLSPGLYWIESADSDGVELTEQATAPEPGTLALSAAALVFAALWIRRGRVQGGQGR